MRFNCPTHFRTSRSQDSNSDLSDPKSSHYSTLLPVYSPERQFVFLGLCTSAIYLARKNVMQALMDFPRRKHVESVLLKLSYIILSGSKCRAPYMFPLFEKWGSGKISPIHALAFHLDILLAHCVSVPKPSHIR